MFRAHRQRLLLGVVLVLLLARTAGQLLSDTGHVRMPTARMRNDPRRTDAPAVSWPQQVASATGGPTIASSGVGASSQDGHAQLLAPSPAGSN